MSIIPSKNYSGGILILRNSVLNGMPRNFTEFRNLIPAALSDSKFFLAELNNSAKLRRNSVVRNSAVNSLCQSIYSYSLPGAGYISVPGSPAILQSYLLYRKVTFRKWFPFIAIPKLILYIYLSLKIAMFFIFYPIHDVLIV